MPVRSGAGAGFANSGQQRCGGRPLVSMEKLPLRVLGESITAQGEQGNVGPKHRLR
ncbi:hypothetical protein CUJ84_Chr000851 [Rhizobium leguminosarum]|uniref:Uncharacterized protein n=1 Tax=Rhizobium leguminosarum TaxID=384 RepID=A0A2K9YZ26_RHILE|nr:hypothetical protein CUJ84_Chr000851 [Rhizobium leguminosarum]